MKYNDRATQGMDGGPSNRTFSWLVVMVITERRRLFALFPLSSLCQYAYSTGTPVYLEDGA